MSMRHKGGDVQSSMWSNTRSESHSSRMTSKTSKGALHLTPKREMGHESPFSAHQGHPRTSILPHRHASSCCKDNHRTVRPLRCASSTSSLFVAGQGLHGKPPHKSSVQAPSQLPGGSYTRPIRREPWCLRVSGRWSEEARQRGEKYFFQTQFIFLKSLPLGSAAGACPEEAQLNGSETHRQVSITRSNDNIKTAFNWASLWSKFYSRYHVVHLHMGAMFWPWSPIFFCRNDDFKSYCECDLWSVC